MLRETASLLLAFPILLAQERVNPNALIVQDFQKSVTAYEHLRKGLESRMPGVKPGDAPAKVEHHRHELAERVRKARKHVKRGDVFTAVIEKEFLRLMGFAMEGPNKAKIETSMRHSEPVRLKLRINDKYPDNVPKQSTPPTLLMNLPRLPPDFEYRVVSGHLLLVDTKTDMVIDFMAEAIP